MVAVLRLTIGIVQDTEDFRHLVSIILKVSPLLAGFEHHLHTLTTRSDEYTDDAQVYEVLTLEPFFYALFRVWNVVTVEHSLSGQISILLNTPQALTSPTVETLNKISDSRDDRWQRTLQLRDVKLHSLQV